MSLDRRTVQQLAEGARLASPSAGDLAGTRAGDPILVVDPQGEPAYWFIPFVRERWACGFVTLAPSGAVRQVGTFGSGASDAAGWIPISYFSGPPALLMSEVRARYPRAALTGPVFSFDRVPSRWGWRVQVDPPDGDVIFVSPRNWYAARPHDGDDLTDRE